ncbi:MAG TPA: hypothetical protein VM658_08230 [bacterium]|nr:hypothetical protein [bacterium]
MVRRELKLSGVMDEGGDQAPPSERFSTYLILSYCVLVAICWLIFPAFFIAGDSYFYLVTARNLALTGRQSFSGIYPTNGLHPLWLYCLSAYSWLVSLVDAKLLYNPAYAAPLPAIFLILGTLSLRRTARSLQAPFAFLALPPVCFLTIFGMLYSEAHLYYFSLSLLSALATEKGRGGLRRHLAVGAAAGLVFLSRLDSVFFVAAFYVWYLVFTRSWVRTMVAGLITSVPALAYMAFNYFYFGGVVTVSGWLKSSFPRIQISGISYNPPVNLGLAGYQVLFGIIPILAAATIALISRKAFHGNRSIIWAFLAGAVLHWLQVSLFTTGFTLWYWYYVLPMVLAGMALAVQAGEATRLGGRSKAFAMIVILCSLVTVGYIKINLGPEKLAGSSSYKTLSYIRMNHLNGQTILVSEWPGMAAFYTDNHIIAADMLTSNRIFIKEMIRSGNALDYIIRYCNAHGHELDYIIYNGGKWLRPTPDNRELVYYDPKLTPLEYREAGRLRVGPPIYSVTSPRLIVWKLGNGP